jgi:hypothetical protein
MPMFIAAHTMPMTEAQFGEMLKTMPAVPKGLAWKQTFCDFASGKFFCEWDAASKDALEQYFKSVKMPFDAVYPVRLFNVAKKKFEDK